VGQWQARRGDKDHRTRTYVFAGGPVGPAKSSLIPARELPPSPSSPCSLAGTSPKSTQIHRSCIQQNTQVLRPPPSLLMSPAAFLPICSRPYMFCACVFVMCVYNNNCPPHACCCSCLLFILPLCSLAASRVEETRR
jgi:hypothetical protein